SIRWCCWRAGPRSIVRSTTCSPRLPRSPSSSTSATAFCPRRRSPTWSRCSPACGEDDGEHNLEPGVYEWVKALHIISVIAWMAGMLYLPRLFVYHCSAPVGSVQSETFKVMERRLLRAIINPAMIATWVFGLWLAWLGGLAYATWFQAK